MRFIKQISAMKIEKRSYFQILKDVQDVLQDWLDGEAPRFDSQLLLKEIVERTHRVGHPGVVKRHDITPKYEEAKKLIAAGKQVGVACSTVGITREQYHRRRRMEQQGRDRKERREY